MPKKKIRNAVIYDCDTMEDHIFYRRFNQGMYYLVGGIEYPPRTLIKLEEFHAEYFDKKLEDIFGTIVKKGTEYRVEHNIEPWIIKQMICDLVPRLRFCA